MDAREHAQEVFTLVPPGRRRGRPEFDLFCAGSVAGPPALSVCGGLRMGQTFRWGRPGAGRGLRGLQHLNAGRSSTAQPEPGPGMAGSGGGQHPLSKANSSLGRGCSGKPQTELMSPDSSRAVSPFRPVGLSPRSLMSPCCPCSDKLGPFRGPAPVEQWGPWLSCWRGALQASPLCHHLRAVLLDC